MQHFCKKSKIIPKSCQNHPAGHRRCWAGLAATAGRRLKFITPASAVAQGRRATKLRVGFLLVAAREDYHLLKDNNKSNFIDKCRKSHFRAYRNSFGHDVKCSSMMCIVIKILFKEFLHTRRGHSIANTFNSKVQYRKLEKLKHVPKMTFEPHVRKHHLKVTLFINSGLIYFRNVLQAYVV